MTFVGNVLKTQSVTNVSSVSRFTINFLRGNDIALHINPRFSEGGKPVLVRNHKLGERWGKEERDLLSPFPFMPGHHFEVNDSLRDPLPKNRLLKRFPFMGGIKAAGQSSK